MINKVYPRRPIATAALFCWPLLVMGWLETWLLGCHPTGGPAPAARVSESMRLMGVPWTITVYADSEAAGRTAIAAGFAEAARLERVR